VKAMIMKRGLKTACGMLKREYQIIRHFMKLLYLKLRGARIGGNTWILESLHRQAGAEPRSIRIGKKCVVCARSLFFCGASHRIMTRSKKFTIGSRNSITIKDNCFIGMGASIMGGVTIGPNAIVGAGAVVLDDVKPDTCVTGNPARFVCSLDSYAKMCENSVIKDYFEQMQKGLDKKAILTHHFWSNTKLQSTFQNIVEE
jgi:acetyltransferase-like isoleucine patch superfamily enzyme